MQGDYAESDQDEASDYIWQSQCVSELVLCIEGCRCISLIETDMCNKVEVRRGGGGGGGERKKWLHLMLFVALALK